MLYTNYNTLPNKEAWRSGGTSSCFTKQQASCPTKLPPGKMELENIDIPIGRGPPELHRKRQQLARLAIQHAPEYAIAPKREGFCSPELDGRFIRSKCAIITSIIEELMQEGGRFMIKKNGVWMVRVGYNSNTKQVRALVQDNLNRIIRSWEGELQPLPPLDEPQPAQNDNEQLHDEVEQMNGGEVEVRDVPARSRQPTPPLGEPSADQKDDEQLHDEVAHISDGEAEGHDVRIEGQELEYGILPPDGKMSIREMLWEFFNSYGDDIIPETGSETSGSSDEPPNPVPSLSHESSSGELSRASEQQLHSDGDISETEQGNELTAHASFTAPLSESHPTNGLRRESEIDSDKMEFDEEVQANENEGGTQSCSAIDTLLASFRWNPALGEDDIIVAESRLPPSVLGTPSTSSTRPLSSTQEIQEQLQPSRKRAKLDSIGFIGLANMALTAILMVVFVPRTSNDQEVSAPTSAPLVSSPRRSSLEIETSDAHVFDDFEHSTGNWTTNKTTLLEFADGNRTRVLGLFEANPMVFPRTEVDIIDDPQYLFLSFDYYVLSDVRNKDLQCMYSLGIELSGGADNFMPVDFGLFFGSTVGEDPDRSRESTSGLVWVLETQQFSESMTQHRVHVFMDSDYLPFGEGRRRRQLGVTIKWWALSTCDEPAELGIDNFLLRSGTIDLFDDLLDFPIFVQDAETPLYQCTMNSEFSEPTEHSLEARMKEMDIVFERRGRGTKMVGFHSMVL